MIDQLGMALTRAVEAFLAALMEGLTALVDSVTVQVLEIIDKAMELKLP